jgi:uncharacterized OB-fold protein
MATQSRRGVFPAPFSEPPVDALTEPFWRAALDGRLVAPRCIGCGTFHLPPPPLCFSCQGDRFEWVELPGTGRIYTFTVVRHPLHPRLGDVVPYVSAVIDLDGTQGAGARMVLNVTHCDPDEVRVGDPVQIWFDRVGDTWSVPRARLQLG